MPEVRRISSDVFEMVFAPKMVLRQLVLAIALETGVVSTQYVLCRIHLLFVLFKNMISWIQTFCGYFYFIQFILIYAGVCKSNNWSYGNDIFKFFIPLSFDTATGRKTKGMYIVGYLYFKI